MGVSVEHRIPGESGLRAEEECEYMLIKGLHTGNDRVVPGCAPASQPPRLTDTAAPCTAPELRAGRTSDSQAAQGSLALIRAPHGWTARDIMGQGGE